MTYQTEQKIWAKRRKKIKGLADSGVSLSDIARRFRISRQRVHQIVGGDQNAKISKEACQDMNAP